MYTNKVNEKYGCYRNANGIFVSDILSLLIIITICFAISKMFLIFYVKLKMNSLHEGMNYNDQNHCIDFVWNEKNGFVFSIPHSMLRFCTSKSKIFRLSFIHLSLYCIQFIHIELGQPLLKSYNKRMTN